MQRNLQGKQFYILHLKYATFQKHFHIIMIFFKCNMVTVTILTT